MRLFGRVAMDGFLSSCATTCHRSFHHSGGGVADKKNRCLINLLFNVASPEGCCTHDVEQIDKLTNEC